MLDFIAKIIDVSKSTLSTLEEQKGRLGNLEQQLRDVGIRLKFCN